MTAPTPTAAPTPEELAEACLKDFARNIGHGSLRERLAAAIRQHSEAQRAEIERLKEQNADLEKAALTAYENGVEHAFEAAKEKAEAALAASQERERKMREALTGLADVMQRDCGVEPCAASMAPAERYLGMARAALQQQETADVR